MPKTQPTTVAEYIKSAPAWAKKNLREMRQAIKAAAPKAKESISYHIPYYNQNGRLAYISVAKNHCSFHWISKKDKNIFAQELAKQRVVGSTLRIPRGEKVPAALIKKIVKSRVRENEPKKA